MNEDNKSKHLVRKGFTAFIDFFFFLLLAKISPAAYLQMQQLLFGYLRLLVPQKKSNESIEKDKIRSSISDLKPIHTTKLVTSSSTKGSYRRHKHLLHYCFSFSFVELNRETKAKMQYIDSTSTLTIASKAESFILIWLDEAIGENYDTVESEEKLRSIVNSLITCRTIDEAKYLIKPIEDQQIYLIVSGQLGQQLLSMNEIMNCSSLNSIYIFCHDQSNHEKLLQGSSKVRAVFNKIDLLCARLKEDTEQAMKNLLPISTSSGTSADEKNQVKFLCSQLHRELLFTMEYNNNAKSELADFCVNIYKSAPTELKHIEELRNQYHTGKAIWW